MAVNVYRRPWQPSAVLEAIQKRVAAVKRGDMDVILVGGISMKLSSWDLAELYRSVYAQGAAGLFCSYHTLLVSQRTCTQLGMAR